jgi:hypothetical protein
MDGESGNACYHPMQNLLSSILLSKNIKNETYRSIILLVSFGCATSSVRLSEEHRLGIFESRMLRKIFGSGRDELTGEYRRLHNEELCHLYVLPHSIPVVIKEGLDGRGM